MAGYNYTTAIIAKDTITGPNFEGTPFTGVFDGNNLKITNLKIDTGGLRNCSLGLFGRIGSGGIIKNLAIEYCSITGGSSSQYLGGLCGYNYYGNITNCYATGNITGGSYLGGLCGYNYNGSISNCYAVGSVTGGGTLGGLCGYSYQGTISNCYATGSVTGGSSSQYLGGLCGRNLYCTISNCYATGSVSGHSSVGGICGANGSDKWRISGTISYCYATGNVTGATSSEYLGGLCGRKELGTIYNCYATGNVIGGNSSQYLGGLCGYQSGPTPNIEKCYSTGNVTGSSYIGGFLGYLSSGIKADCFWDMQTSGMAVGVGYGSSEGVYGCTTEQMQQKATFTGYGWDFTDIWSICEGTNYPKLLWSVPQGDFLCPDGVNFTDYAYFTDFWNSNDPNADFDLSGMVDANDLVIFSNDWLKGF